MNETALAAYVKHARRFGTELVYETARHDVAMWARQAHPRPVDLAWMTPAPREQVLAERERYRRELEQASEWLLRLRVEFDAIETTGKGTKRRRRAPAQTAAVAGVLLKQGLVEVAVANRLGISKRRLRQLVRDYAKRESRTRIVERQNGSRNRNPMETPVAA